VGADFAERLTNAFQCIFDKGYEHVIAIGSDCPALHASLIQKAFQAVSLHGAVLGPSKDGGVYLLGLSKHHFENIDFKSIDWKTGHVYHQLESVLPLAGGQFLLPVLSDIDNAKDLAEAIHHFVNHSLFNFIRGTLAAVTAAFFRSKQVPITVPLFSFGLKAPPVTI